MFISLYSNHEIKKGGHIVCMHMYIPIQLQHAGHTVCVHTVIVGTYHNSSLPYDLSTADECMIFVFAPPLCFQI